MSRPKHPFPARRRSALQRRLLDWYRASHRDLPWRRRSDPYAVWVSEVMLQQTQVATVVPHFERFQRRFPTIAALAAASEQEVLAAWQGLGYYRRARCMLSAAREIVARHGGVFPAEEQAALGLPGVGRYTAGAVLSIAYGRQLPVVDGNVARVLIRLEALEGNADDTGTVRRLWELASELVRVDDPGAWNQALMELGALVCTPAAPDCGRCPLATLCRSRARGRERELPPPRNRRRPPKVEIAVAWLVADGRIGLVQRRRDGVLAAFWELPEVDVPAGQSPSVLLQERLEDLGVPRARVGSALANVEHRMFHRRARMTAYDVEAEVAAPLRLVQPDAIGELPITTASRKLMDAVLARAEQLQLAPAPSVSSGRRSRLAPAKRGAGVSAQPALSGRTPADRRRPHDADPGAR